MTDQQGVCSTVLPKPFEVQAHAGIARCSVNGGISQMTLADRGIGFACDPALRSGLALNSIMGASTRWARNGV